MTDSQDIDFYKDYEQWKGWDDLFNCSDEDAEYYAGECSMARIDKANILELGFGAGHFLDWAIKNGANVAGTELNPKLCQAAKDRGIELLPTDINSVVKSNRERFDLIVAFDVFEHLELNEIVENLNAFEAMLKEGGFAILRFPNGQSPFGL